MSLSLPGRVNVDFTSMGDEIPIFLRVIFNLPQIHHKSVQFRYLWNTEVRPQIQAIGLGADARKIVWLCQERQGGEKNQLVHQYRRLELSPAGTSGGEGGVGPSGR